MLVRPVTLTEPLLTVAQAAELLGLSRGAVYALCRRQDDPLPTLRLGSALRIERAALERWLTRRTG